MPEWVWFAGGALLVWMISSSDTAGALGDALNRLFKAPFEAADLIAKMYQEWQERKLEGSQLTDAVKGWEANLKVMLDAAKEERLTYIKVTQLSAVISFLRYCQDYPSSAHTADAFNKAQELKKMVEDGTLKVIYDSDLILAPIADKWNKTKVVSAADLASIKTRLTTYESRKKAYASKTEKMPVSEWTYSEAGAKLAKEIMDSQGASVAAKVKK